jgi:hypothetical protein
VAWWTQNNSWWPNLCKVWWSLKEVLGMALRDEIYVSIKMYSSLLRTNILGMGNWDAKCWLQVNYSMCITSHQVCLSKCTVQRKHLNPVDGIQSLVITDKHHKRAMRRMMWWSRRTVLLNHYPSQGVGADGIHLNCFTVWKHILNDMELVDGAV